MVSLPASMPILTTERLRLRPCTLRDAPAIQRLAGAREVAAGGLRIPHPYPDGAAEAWVLSHRGAFQRGDELSLAIATIALSWAAVHTTFALHYAHDYYRGAKCGGLQFPSGDAHDRADYWDFVYFSFVIGMTAQVSDVGITDKTIRRTATAHGIVSFLYNTALLALMVNIAASAISG